MGEVLFPVCCQCADLVDNGIRDLRCVLRREGQCSVLSGMPAGLMSVSANFAISLLRLSDVRTIEHTMD